MHAWESIQKTLDYIEEHISSDIQIDALAEMASLSRFYFHRLFSRLVKRPVREYVKLRRLACACEELGNKKNRILDIALRYGFGSHEVFTRAFKEVYGLTPTEYRESPVGVDHFTKPDLLLNYVLVDEGVPLISEGLVLEMNRRTLAQPIDFIGIAEYMPFTPGKMLGERPGVSMPDAIWGKFFQSLKHIPGICDGRTLGCCFKGAAPDGYTTYFAGAEAAPEAAVPEIPSCIKWQMPARPYVVCGFEAEDFEGLTGHALGKAMKYTRMWLKKHGLIADGFFPEMYYPNTAETAYMELWVPFRNR